MDKPIKENQAVNPSQSTASGPVGTDENITPPPPINQPNQINQPLILTRW